MHIVKGLYYHKARKKKKVKKSEAYLYEYSNKLNKNLPKSEQWFHELLKKDNLHHLFQYNQVIGMYIIDAYYKDKKLAIEIDGSYHKLEEQKYKDFLKNRYLDNRGISIIRIEAYNVEAYELFKKYIK